MPKWKGCPDRIRQRIAELGFRNPSHFADVKRYRVTDVHKWVRSATPAPETLERLAKDLETSPEWLLFGDVIYERNKKRRAISGGSDAPTPDDGGRDAALCNARYSESLIHNYWSRSAIYWASAVAA